MRPRNHNGPKVKETSALPAVASEPTPPKSGSVKKPHSQPSETLAQEKLRVEKERLAALKLINKEIMATKAEENKKISIARKEQEALEKEATKIKLISYVTQKIAGATSIVSNANSAYTALLTRRLQLQSTQKKSTPVEATSKKQKIAISSKNIKPESPKKTTG